MTFSELESKQKDGKVVEDQKVVLHKINTGDAISIRQSSRRLPLAEEEEVK